MKTRRVSTLSLLAVGTWLATASCGSGGGGSSTGTAGTAGAAGTSGTAGSTSTTGTAGTTDTGTAGSAATAGSTGTAGSNTAGTSGAAGTAGTTGTSGTAGTTGTAGSTGTTDGGAPAGIVTGMSDGCGKPMAAGDVSSKYLMRSIMVTAATTMMNRVYYIDLPAGYESSKPYPILFGGAGCGGAPNTNGSSGGFGVLPTNNTDAIQIGLSYTGQCFEQGGANNPELPYFDAVLQQVEANYCVDKGRVFVGGYSSGGWLSYMLAFARGGVVRGISTAAGGLATVTGRPPDTMVPVAGLLLTGATDTTNPASGPTGSDAAMALMLQYNGCAGGATGPTVPWPTTCAGCGCKQFTNCPAAYPVIRCYSSLSGHTDGGGNYKTAIWQTWMSLPTP